MWAALGDYGSLCIGATCVAGERVLTWEPISCSQRLILHMSIKEKTTLKYEAPPLSVGSAFGLPNLSEVCYSIRPPSVMH